RGGDPEVTRVDVKLVHVAVRDLPDTAVSRRGQLVEAILTTEDEGGRAARAEHTRNDRHNVNRCDAHGVRFRTRRVDERTEEVENGRNAELRAHAGGVLETGVESCGPRERDAGFRQHASNRVGGETQVNAESTQNV